MIQVLKIALSLIGLAMALLAVATDKPSLTWVAIGLLATAVILRFVGAKTNK